MSAKDDPEHSSAKKNQPDAQASQSRTEDAFVNGMAYPHPFDDYVVQLCSSASRYICILSPQLDHTVFDRAELVDALSALARATRQTRIRILVSDTREMVHRGHKLLELARRLPSSVRMQKLNEHPAWNDETVIIRDRDGVMYKPGGTGHDAFYEPKSRASTERHLERFEELWRQSSQDPDLRSLSL